MNGPVFVDAPIRAINDPPIRATCPPLPTVILGGKPPRDTNGPFVTVFGFVLKVFPLEEGDVLSNEALRWASFLVKSLSPCASLKCTDKTDFVVKFAEQCSHLNPAAPFSRV